MKFGKIFLLILFLLLIPLVQAENKTSQIQEDFLEVEDLITRLSSDGFNVVRVNDTLKAAKQIFDAQQNIRDENRRDYELVEQYISEIKEMEDQAYLAKDEIDYVYDLYEDVKQKNPDLDLSEAEGILEEMEFEFQSEIYDEAYDLAKEAYSKIVEIEGSHTALNVAYEATTRSIRDFFVNNWLTLLIILAVSFIAYLVFKNRIIYYNTKYKIRKLETESKVIEELIRQTQKNYFEQGTMSESTYRVRIKKFSELVRDINRQLPLLREELAKRKKGDPYADRDREVKKDKGNSLKQQIESKYKKELKSKKKTVKKTTKKKAKKKSTKKKKK